MQSSLETMLSIGHFRVVSSLCFVAKLSSKVFDMKRFFYSPANLGVVCTPSIVYTERLHPKAVPFSGFRYEKGQGFHLLKYMKRKEKLSFWSVKRPRRTSKCAVAMKTLR